MVALKFHQYQMVGRALPKDAEDTPKIFRMKLWHTNDVRAKSKFWYFLKKVKVKKSNGQIVAINENRFSLARLLKSCCLRTSLSWDE
ncbi:60S ribosomal protein L18a isoform X2 [Rosa chinensis]|uniref:60S ribosomal protein L18a isoform X2 n=1 Tax=Rosa chinensis TaxID=74649 RepID=UPI000D0974C8|nr:60S ribosomal protein L18a isoform X2 [Rosa chinensis]